MDAQLKFRMPRYNEIPNVGLYLEQTVKYINQCIEPLHLSITGSMLSNYVKKGYIRRPVKKLYYADQIAYLIFIAVVKQTLSMENICKLFKIQQQSYTAEVAYNYFIKELEIQLQNLFNGKNIIRSTNGDSFGKNTLTKVVVAISHCIYLNFCFEEISNDALDFENI